MHHDLACARLCSIGHPHMMLNALRHTCANTWFVTNDIPSCCLGYQGSPVYVNNFLGCRNAVAPAEQLSHAVYHCDLFGAG